MVITVVIASFLVFILMRSVPGTIVDSLVAQYRGQLEADMDVNLNDVKALLEAELGLDRPFMVQYVEWFGKAIRGDLGNSLWRKTPVVEEIAKRFPVTIELGLLAFVMAQLIAFPIGIYSAIRQETLGDYTGRGFAILLVAVPDFWIGTMIVVFGSIWWGYAPPIRFIGLFDDPVGHFKMLLIPAAVLGMALAGGQMRMTRTMLLEVLRQDYVRTAWSKGLKENVIILRHALRNALIPVVTSVGPQLLIMVSGSVVIEQIFNLPGMGRLTLQAIETRDYPVVSGVLLVFAVALVLMNLLIDLTYSFLDPRIRYD
jgi:peptide/nickel transport system permease protein